MELNDTGICLQCSLLFAFWSYSFRPLQPKWLRTGFRHCNGWPKQSLTGSRCGVRQKWFDSSTFPLIKYPSIYLSNHLKYGYHDYILQCWKFWNKFAMSVYAQWWMLSLYRNQSENCLVWYIMSCQLFFCDGLRASCSMTNLTVICFHLQLSLFKLERSSYAGADSLNLSQILKWMCTNVFHQNVHKLQAGCCNLSAKTWRELRMLQLHACPFASDNLPSPKARMCDLSEREMASQYTYWYGIRFIVD